MSVERIDVDRSDRLTADQIYERRWAFTVLEQVMARLREEYRSSGNLRFFDQMKKMLMDEPDRPSQAQVATEFDMTENAVKQAFYRFRQRYHSRTSVMDYRGKRKSFLRTLDSTYQKARSECGPNTLLKTRNDR